MEKAHGTFTVEFATNDYGSLNIEVTTPDIFTSGDTLTIAVINGLTKAIEGLLEITEEEAKTIVLAKALGLCRNVDIARLEELINQMGDMCNE